MGFLKIRISFILILLEFGLFSNAQEKTTTYFADPACIPPDLPIKIKHLTARINFQPEQNLVKGTAEFTFTFNHSQVDSIIFYTPDFQIESVKLNNFPVKFHLTGNNLVLYTRSGIYPSPTAIHALPAGRQALPVITIKYTAKPLSGAIYFIGWKPEESGKRKEIWAHRPHGWLPYLDARITTDIFITFDKKYRVFSNGERLNVTENPEGTLTWHYAMRKNHPFFSTSLVIGDYRYKKSNTSRGIPLEYWYYSDMPDRVGTTYKYTEKMFVFFEKEMGVPYPYPVYREAPVIDYMYGAMETTTSTVFGDYMLITPRSWWQRNYVNVNAHELAHQWFGNYVAHFVNRDVWLTESFGTYYAKLFEKSIYGTDYYQNIRNDEMFQALEASKKNNYPVGGSQGGVQRIYQKGSLVLDMLRDVMGEQEFKDAIKLYLQRYGFNYAETNDFIRCVYEASGKPYNWFFEEWILRGGEPEYKISDSVVNDSLGNRYTQFKVWQVQEVNELNGLFKMPVGFEVHYKDGTCDSLKGWIENKYTRVLVQNTGKKAVDFVLFDPNRKILKKATFEHSYEQLVAQAVKAVNMIDRYDAWLALRSVPVDKKSEILAAAFRRENFWLIRSEILGQLAADHSPETTEVFHQALHDRDANVRKAALKNLNSLPDLLQSTVEGMLYDSSYLNVELALSSLCASFPKNTDYYLELTRDMQGWRGINIRMKWLEIAIGSGKKEFLPELISYSGPKFEFETRMNAFNLLKKIKYSDEQTINNARSASKHWNNKLSAVGKEYLKQMTSDK